jgi:hypothetical protein
LCTGEIFFGKLENCKVGKLENWKVGKLEKRNPGKLKKSKNNFHYCRLG